MAVENSVDAPAMPHLRDSSRSKTCSGSDTQAIRKGSSPRLITHKTDGGMTNQTIYLGDDLLRACNKDVDGQYVERDGETYYRIGNIDAMNDFFISVVSDSNHWLFISTRGGLTAGRTDCDSALFPYYTEDKIRQLPQHRESDALDCRAQRAPHLVAAVRTTPPHCLQRGEQSLQECVG